MNTADAEDASAITCPVHSAQQRKIDSKSHIQSTTRGLRPPLVKSVPFIGPLRQFTGDVLPFLHETRARYGDAFRIRICGIEMTCLCGPDAIALLEAGSSLGTRQSMQVLDKELESRLPSTFSGPQHKMFRKVHTQFLNRALESKKRDVIVGCLNRHTARWQPGQDFDVLDEAQTQTVDVLSHILNGEPFPFTKSELATVVHTLIYATYGHVPKWLVLNNPRYRSAKKRMRAHLLDLIARIRRDPELIADTLVGQFLDFPPPEGTDRWEDTDLFAVPMAAYLAGYDTVASAASFLLYFLLSNPECLAQVRQEYAELSRESDGHVDPIKQTFLRAAFQETVRINPPGALVVRYADEDFEFAGYSIRKGDEIIVQISGDHLNEEMFPDPNTFDPTRFLGPDANRLKQHVLPFGSGAHRCTGAMVGQLFAEEMVSYWVNNFDLALFPDARKPRVVARPFTQPVGLRVKVVGRRSGQQRPLSA